MKDKQEPDVKVCKASIRKIDLKGKSLRLITFWLKKFQLTPSIPLFDALKTILG